MVQKALPANQKVGKLCKQRGKGATLNCRNTQTASQKVGKLCQQRGGRATLNGLSPW